MYTHTHTHTTKILGRQDDVYSACIHLVVSHQVWWAHIQLVVVVVLLNHCVFTNLLLSPTPGSLVHLVVCVPTTSIFSFASMMAWARTRYVFFVLIRLYFDSIGNQYCLECTSVAFVVIDGFSEMGFEFLPYLVRLIELFPCSYI